MEYYRIRMKDKEGKKGFTLVELLVSFFMFVIVIGGMTSSLLKAVKVQQRMVANQKMLTEANFLMDRVARALKFAQSDSYISTYLPTQIDFEDLNGEYRWFLFLDEQVKESINDSDSVSINSENIKITQLTFSSAGSNWDSAEEHPRVAISMTIKSKETGDEITVQTVVSPLKKDVSLPQD